MATTVAANTNGHLAKTKMCKFHSVGKCAKGPHCPFAHTSVELRPTPDLRKTKLCMTMKQTGRCDDEKCTFAHSKKELRSIGSPQKPKIASSGKTSKPAPYEAPTLLEMPPGLEPPPGLGETSTQSGESDQDDVSGDSSSWTGTTTPKKDDDEMRPAYVHIGSPSQEEAADGTNIPSELDHLAGHYPPLGFGLDAGESLGLHDISALLAQLELDGTMDAGIDYTGIDYMNYMSAMGGYPPYDPSFGASISDGYDYDYFANGEKDDNSSGYYGDYYTSTV